MAVQEWTDEFITNAQHELVALVKDWKYDYGTDDRDCAAMLLWMVLKLYPPFVRTLALTPLEHWQLPASNLELKLVQQHQML